MMVADDEIDAQSLGVGNLLYGLDATVENNDEFHPRVLRILQSFAAHPITLIVAVGNVVVDVGVELLQELVHQSHGSASIDIVVAIYKDTLLPSHGVIEPVDGHIHILHEEGIDEVGELRTEESFGGTLGGDASAYEQLCKDGADVQLVA